MASKFDHLDQLINNAGVWHSEFTASMDGIEETFQVNVIAPYLFIKNLKPLLDKAETPKVINTASSLHTGTVNFNDIQYKAQFSGFKAYRQSKLSIILLTRLFASRGQKIQYYAQHPGVVNTSLGRHMGGLANLFFKFIGVSKEKGAQTLLHLSETPVEKLQNGEYYAKSAPKRITKESYDMQAAARLEETIISMLE